MKLVRATLAGMLFLGFTWVASADLAGLLKAANTPGNRTLPAEIKAAARKATDIRGEVSITGISLAGSYPGQPKITATLPGWNVNVVQGVGKGGKYQGLVISGAGKVLSKTKVQANPKNPKDD
jgi:hypothetical protein